MTQANKELSDIQEELKAAMRLRQRLDKHMQSLNWSADRVATAKAELQKVIVAMLHADSQEILAIQQQGAQDIVKLFSLQDDAFHELIALRKSHVPQKINRLWRMFSLSWVGIDVFLLVFSTILTFANLGLGGAALGLTIGAIGYGLIDTYKNRNAPHPSQTFSVADLSNDIKTKLKQEFPTLDVDEFVHQPAEEEKNWQNEKQFFRKVACVLSGLGMLLALAGIIFVVPPVGIPLAATIAATVINSVIVAGSLALVSYKMFREDQRIASYAEIVEKEKTVTKAKLNQPNYTHHESTHDIITAGVASLYPHEVSSQPEVQVASQPAAKKTDEKREEEDEGEHPSAHI